MRVSRIKRPPVPATDKQLAALAARHNRLRKRANALNALPGAAAERDDIYAEGGTWEQLIAEIENAEVRLCIALKERGLVGIITGGRLFVDFRRTLPDESQDSRNMAGFVFDSTKILDLDRQP